MLEHRKFKTRSEGNGGFRLEREVITIKGGLVVFKVASTDVASFLLDKKIINFDTLSDDKLKEVKNLKNTQQATFIWNKGIFVRT